MTPCSFGDVGAKRHDYIYTVKAAGGLPEGSEPTHLAATRLHAERHVQVGLLAAGTLTLDAGNFSEIKNNEVLLIFDCSELVTNSFFDVVEVVFSIVGHTHTQQLGPGNWGTPSTEVASNPRA